MTNEEERAEIMGALKTRLANVETKLASVETKQELLESKLFESELVAHDLRGELEAVRKTISAVDETVKGIAKTLARKPAKLFQVAVVIVGLFFSAATVYAAFKNNELTKEVIQLSRQLPDTHGEKK